MDSDYEYGIVPRQFPPFGRKSKDPEVKIEDVLLVTVPVLARLVTAIANRNGTKTQSWRLLAAELDTIAETLSTLYHPTETITGDMPRWSSSPKYVGIRNPAFLMISTLVSGQSLSIALRNAKYQTKVPPTTLWRGATLHLWHLYGYLNRATRKGVEVKLHAHLLHDDLSNSSLEWFVLGIKPLRYQLSNLLQMQQGHHEYRSWHPAGCDSTQWNLFTLWYAIATTWTSGLGGSAPADGPMSPVSSCKLLLENIWSRDPEGASYFSLLLQCPQGLQEITVETRAHSIVNPWASARQFDQKSGLRHCLCTQHPNYMGGFGEGLLMLGSVKTEKSWDAADEFLLSDVVASGELHYREKMILCLTLSRSLLDLLLTPWLRADWGLADIHIFGWKKQDSEYHLDLRHPYLSVNLAAMSQAKFYLPVNGLVDVSDPVHPYPQVLSLGIAIMQILIGDRLAVHTLSGDVSVGTGSRLALAFKLQEECEARRPKQDPIMRVIGQCIKPTMIEHATTTESLTQSFWESIVFPLQEAVLTGEGQPSTDGELWTFLNQPVNQTVLGDPNTVISRARKRKFDEISTLGPTEMAVSTALDDLINGLQVVTPGGTVPQTPDYSGRMSQTPDYPGSTMSQTPDYLDNLSYLASRFLSPLANISEVLRNLNERHISNAFRPDKVWDKMVRVVILDTGCNFSLPEIRSCIVGDNRGDDQIRKKDRRPGIVGWRDFIDTETWHPGDLLQDTSENQHGTTMVKLFMTVMGHAKLYIARVMDHSQTMDQQTSERVAEAIEYAITEWKADIISISLAIDTAPQHIRDRIKAAGERTLIFAAAGNNRQPNPREIAFPASARSVVCIHSHDGHGKPSRFSPNPQPHKTNFQVIGQDLRIPGTNGEPDIFVEGTSCSTPLAAAIAAFVLDFVQAHRLTWEEQRHLPYSSEYQKKLKNLLVDRCDLLKDEQVMKRIFYECMTSRAKLGKYHPLNPEMLFSVGEGWVDKAVTLLGQQLEKVVENTEDKHY